ncbi:hypothetical protein LCGC14_2124080, partial [marine sediment metagenome]
MRTLWISLLLCVLAQAAGGGEFGQWRGPARNGIIPDSPALIAAWPKAGPVKLWASEEIPSGKSGGFGCVVVAGGKTAWTYRVAGRPHGWSCSS